jgi:hypothetical protein
VTERDHFVAALHHADAFEGITAFLRSVSRITSADRARSQRAGRLAAAASSRRRLPRLRSVL